MNELMTEQIKLINTQIKELAALYHDVASRSGISDNEFWVWYVLLVFEGEYSQQDICNIWSFPKQTINTIVANLSKKGYIFLEADPGARNRKLIRLTESGRSYGESVVMDLYHSELRALEKLSDDERAGYVSMMGKYLSLLKDEVYEP